MVSELIINKDKDHNVSPGNFLYSHLFCFYVLIVDNHTSFHYVPKLFYQRHLQAPKMFFNSFSGKFFLV